MEWMFTEDRPIFQQLYEALAKRIVVGEYPPGGRMPSVRELAAEAGVNPNTMQRALSQLDEAGLTESNRTAGRTVTTAQDRIDTVRNGFASEAARAYLEAARSLGLSREEAIKLLNDEEEMQ